MTAGWTTGSTVRLELIGGIDFHLSIVGLMRDDLLPAENPVVQEALKRISDKEAFDRTFRLRRAVQLYMSHSELAPHEQISFEKVRAQKFCCFNYGIGLSVSVAQD